MYDPVSKKEKVGLRSTESSSIISSRWSSRSMLNSAVRIISSRSTDSLATSTSKTASVNSKYLSKSSKNSDDVVSTPVKKFPHYIVIEGMEGLSLSKIAEAYKEQVLQRKRKIVAFFEVGMEEDKGKNFGVMARLLVSIIKHQCHTSFGDESEQRRVLMHLLSDTYPLASKGEIEHYISFFQDVLMLEWNSGTDDDNITYGVDREVEDEEDSEEAAGSLSRDQLLLSMERSPLVEVFMHLAHELCCAVVIENAHYCDELSWQLLDQLFRMNPPHLVFFITLYPLSDQGLSRNSVITSSSIHEVSEMTHSASTRNSIGTMAYQSIVFNHRSQLISLSSLREEDVELLICKILNITSISSQLLQIICDVSLANPIWYALKYLIYCSCIA